MTTNEDAPVTERATRTAVLIRARNRAMSILAQRHQEEFDAIKNELLVTAGHDPIDPDRQRRDQIIDEKFPLDTKVEY
jgi:hypothetical protein